MNSKFTPQTDGRLIPIAYGRLAMIDSTNFMELSPNTIVKAMNLDDSVHN